MNTHEYAPGQAAVPTGTYVGPDDNPDLYQLVRHIGVGGEAQVWLAKTRPDPNSQAAITVAVKVFNLQGPESIGQEWLLRTQAMAHVRNPGLAQTLNVFVGGPMHRLGELPDPRGHRLRYLVMEYVDGPSLQEWVEDHPDATLRERFNLLGTIAAALDSLHAGTDAIPPIAHGDIKPDNARLTSDGGIKLVDFGLMRMQGTNRNGPAMASIPYTAPEIFTAGTEALPTPGTDRFSFAATVFQVLTGQIPPIRPDGCGPDPSAMRPILESSFLTAGRPEIVNAVMAGLAPVPGDRPRILTQWLGGARVTSSVVTGTTTHVSAVASPATPQPDRTGRRGLLGVIGAVVLLLIAVGGGYALAGGGGSGKATAGTGSASSQATLVASQTTPPASTTSTDSTPSGSTSASGTATDATSSPSTPSDTLSVGVTTDPNGNVITNTFGAPVLLAGDDGISNGSIARQDGVGAVQQVSINGKTFDTGFIASCQGTCGMSSIDLNLERKYSTFTGRVGIEDDGQVNKSASVKIVADGKLLAQRTVALGVSYDLSLPVKNVLRLQILFSAYDHIQPAIGDPTAIP